MIYKVITTTPVESVKAELEVKAKEFGFGILMVGSLDVDDKVAQYMHSIFDKVSLIMHSWDK